MYTVTCLLGTYSISDCIQSQTEEFKFSLLQFKMLFTADPVIGTDCPGTTYVLVIYSSQISMLCHWTATQWFGAEWQGFCRQWWLNWLWCNAQLSQTKYWSLSNFFGVRRWLHFCAKYWWAVWFRWFGFAKALVCILGVSLFVPWLHVQCKIKCWFFLCFICRSTTLNAILLFQAQSFQILGDVRVPFNSEEFNYASAQIFIETHFVWECRNIAHALIVRFFSDFTC